MIIVLHENNRLVKILDENRDEISFAHEKNMAMNLVSLAKMYPKSLILWCEASYFSVLNVEKIEHIFHHKRIMASYSVRLENFLPKQIGYVEGTPFINVNYKVRFPTWFMSSDVGGIHAEVLNLIEAKRITNSNFEYFLNSLAKHCMRKGLFCYSEPELLIAEPTQVITKKSASTRELFKFIKQHYKSVWIFIAFASYFCFEKHLPIISFINALFVSRLKMKVQVENVNINSSRKSSQGDTYDIIIPTMGRKKYLYDFLKDIANQTLLPSNVIIVEQNPDVGSISELDYIRTEEWPFSIKHHFINTTGACQARNLAIPDVSSSWAVLADDDCRIPEKLYQEMLGYLKKYGTNVLTASCLQPGEEQLYDITEQTTIFGSGASILRSSLLKKVEFDTAFEFGYGEDIDFGMQLRNLGEDVIYCPYVEITHLKAPMGGFRTNFSRPWDKDSVQPKPSPTVMLFNLKHRTKEQINGYRMSLYIKMFAAKKPLNPFGFLKTMNRGWNQSTKWGKQLLAK